MAQGHSSHASKFGDSDCACAYPSSSQSSSSRPVGSPKLLFKEHLSLLGVDRIWSVAFSVGTRNTTPGRSESGWLLSIGLGNHSMPAWVDGDFLVLRRLPPVDGRDTYEPTFSLPLGHDPCKLQPGPASAIKMHLDEGPMRPHLLNECVNTR